MQLKFLTIAGTGCLDLNAHCCEFLEVSFSFLE